MKVGFIVQIKLALIMEFASNSGLILFAIVIGLHLLGLRVHRVKYITVCYKNLKKVQNVGK